MQLSPQVRPRVAPAICGLSIPFLAFRYSNGSTNPNACLLSSVALCPHVMVLQTGNWYAIQRSWPVALRFTDVVSQTMGLISKHCPATRIVWLPPSLQHGGAEKVVQHAQKCNSVSQLINASQFSRILHITRRANVMVGGKNANVGARHRAQLLALENGTLDVLDITLIGQARADAHIEHRDNCGHWCLPGVPEVFGGALVQHLCGEALPNPRTCTAL